MTEELYSTISMNYDAIFRKEFNLDILVTSVLDEGVENSQWLEIVPFEPGFPG